MGGLPGGSGIEAELRRLRRKGEGVTSVPVTVFRALHVLLTHLILMAML